MHKKLTILVAITLAVAVYASPMAVTKAGAGPVVSGFTTPLAAVLVAQAAIETPIILHLRVTAYASVPDETDSTPFITANGTRVHDGVIASNQFPFGTQVEIPALFGDKVFTVDDRMSARIKNTVDIWMPSRAKAIVFGVRYADIVVLAAHPAGTDAAALSLK